MGAKSKKIRVYQREDGRYYIGRERPDGWVEILSHGFPSLSAAMRALKTYR